jgi:hypothetical protein
MALTFKDFTVLLALNLGHNQIGSEGCEYLSQVEYLNLSKNDIQSEDVKQLIDSNWPLLK